MAPVVRSILSTKTGFDPGSMDLFACGSTLGNLLRFIRGIDKPFRFHIEVIGNTVFFVRRENDPRELIEDIKGFGHTFPEAYTTWDHDVKGSETHQRIVQYDFGGFKCLLRFECDGYIDDTPRDGRASSSDGLGGNKSSQRPNEDEVLEALQGAAISKPFDTTSDMNDGALVIKRGGEVVPDRSIFDLKTRSGRYRKEIDMSEQLPLLWIKQIPNFIVAYHDGQGTFRNIQVKDVRDDVQDWEKDNIEAIRRLTVLLREIVHIAKQDKGRLLEAYSPGVNKLEIRYQHGDGEHALPAGLRDEWVDGKEEPFVAHDDHSSDATLDADDDLDSEKGWDADLDEEEPDYTACSVEDCGYCGKCTY